MMFAFREIFKSNVLAAPHVVTIQNFMVNSTFPCRLIWDANYMVKATQWAKT